MSVVVLDLEPGGNFGQVGLCEITARQQIGDACTLSFANFRPETLNSRGRPLFAEIWPYVDAFVGDRPVLTWNLGYDAPEILRLLRRHGITSVPQWHLWCALKIVRREKRRTGDKGPLDLAWLAVDRGYLDEADLALRRASFMVLGGNKWVLPRSQDDAWAAARAVLDHTGHYGRPVDQALLSTLDHPRTFADFKPSKRRIPTEPSPWGK